MTLPTTDWTTRITLTLALALAAGCTPSMDATPAADGTFASAHTDGPTSDGPVIVEVEDTADESVKGSDEGDEHGDDSSEEPVIAEEPDVPNEEVKGEEAAEEATGEVTATFTPAAECAVGPGEGSAGIQQCLATVEAMGGIVTLEEGEYIVTDTITVPSGVELAGAGLQTVLTLDSGANVPVILVGQADENPTRRASQVVLRDFAIFGNGGDQTSESTDEAAWIPVAGIVFRNAADSKVANVAISETASSGVMIDAGSERIMLEVVEVIEAAFDGITVQASTEITVSRTTLQDNGGSGISFDWGVTDSVVVGSTILGNGYRWGGGDNPGVYMAMTSGVSVEGSTVSRNDGNGIVLTNQGMAADPTKTCSSANTFRSNTVSENGQFGFWLTHSTCEANRSIDNDMLSNAWGPVFEPVCGQLDTVAGTCEGPGCSATCGD